MAAKKVHAPRFHVLVIERKDKVSKRTLRMSHRDFVTWVNPTESSFRITFTEASPLSRRIGSVASGSPSARWFQLSKSALKGKHYPYRVRSRSKGSGSGPGGGPEIVPND